MQYWVCLTTAKDVLQKNHQNGDDSKDVLQELRQEEDSDSEEESVNMEA